MGEQTKKTIVAIPEGTLRPLINEQDTEIRDKAILSVEKMAKSPKDCNTGCFKKKVTATLALKVKRGYFLC
jgi:hypothetical protein